MTLKVLDYFSIIIQLSKNKSKVIKVGLSSSEFSLSLHLVTREWDNIYESMPSDKKGEEDNQRKKKSQKYRYKTSESIVHTEGSIPVFLKG